jgi:hypothetical protein
VGQSSHGESIQHQQSINVEDLTRVFAQMMYSGSVVGQLNDDSKIGHHVRKLEEAIEASPGSGAWGDSLQWLSSSCSA